MNALRKLACCVVAGAGSGQVVAGLASGRPLVALTGVVWILVAVLVYNM